MLEMTGAVTVNVLPALFTPLTVMTTDAVGRIGTTNPIAVLDQLVGVIAMPSYLSVLVPCVLPNPVPLTVTAVPTGPVLGERLLMTGVTVSVDALLTTLFTVTVMSSFVCYGGTRDRN